MIEIALLILTLTGDGVTRVTLTPVDGPADCAAQAEVVTQILTEAGTPPLTARCGETGLVLSPFEHGLPPSAEVHRYRVELVGSDGFAIAPLAPGETCRADPQAMPAVICARSGQRVVSDD